MRLLSGLFASLLIAGPASAAVTIDMREVSGDVIVTALGSIDTTGMRVFAGPEYLGEPYGLEAEPFAIDFGRPGPYTIFSFARSGLSGIGGGKGVIEADYRAGSGFYFNAGEGANPSLLGLYVDYESGTALAASMMFLGRTFADMGLTRGSYSWALPADTITVNVGPPIIPPPPAPPPIEAAVPEPGSWAAILAGFGVLGGALRRGRSASRRSIGRSGPLSG